MHGYLTEDTLAAGTGALPRRNSENTKRRGTGPVSVSEGRSVTCTTVTLNTTGRKHTTRRSTNAGSKTD